MVKVRVPATTANMGPGFDVLGMALNIYNYVEMWEISDGLEIIVDGEGKDSIDRGKNNIAYLIARRVFDRVGHEPSGLGIRLVNEIPTARGLGSSAAALVGAALAANVVSGSIDEPRAGAYYGGRVAAPVFADVVASSLRRLGVQPDAPLESLVAVGPNGETAR